MKRWKEVKFIQLYMCVSELDVWKFIEYVNVCWDDRFLVLKTCCEDLFVH